MTYILKQNKCSHWTCHNILSSLLNKGRESLRKDKVELVEVLLPHLSRRGLCDFFHWQYNSALGSQYRHMFDGSTAAGVRDRKWQTSFIFLFFLWLARIITSELVLTFYMDRFTKTWMRIGIFGQWVPSGVSNGFLESSFWFIGKIRPVFTFCSITFYIYIFKIANQWLHKAYRGCLTCWASKLTYL